MAKKTKKIKQMSTNEKITAVQNCIQNGNTKSDYFFRLNDSLPVHYRIK
jgi:hypothetical protein